MMSLYRPIRRQSGLFGVRAQRRGFQPIGQTITIAVHTNAIETVRVWCQQCDHAFVASQ